MKIKSKSQTGQENNEKSFNKKLIIRNKRKCISYNVKVGEKMKDANG